MITLSSAGAPSPFWYLTRGTGAASLVLLTVSLGLGILNVSRLRTVGVPRFVVYAVHRSASLLAVVFVAVHILTSLLDGYAPITVVDAVVPFVSAYRPLWLGFGALAFDLLLAVAITSLMRQRLGYRAWRLTHWAAYASWPVAVLHGLGTGTDAKAHWMLVLTAACVIAVSLAVVARAADGWPSHSLARAGAVAASVTLPVALLVWLPTGPLAPGWAKRAGTPGTLLAASTAGVSAVGPERQLTPFTAHASGNALRGPFGDELTQVHVALAIAGQRLSYLGVRIIGTPDDEGDGVTMTESRVEIGSTADHGQYRGHVTSLNGTDIMASVSDQAGDQLEVVAHLRIDPARGLAAGSVTVSPQRPA